MMKFLLFRSLVLFGLLLGCPFLGQAQFALKGFSGSSTSFTNDSDGIVNYFAASAYSQNPGPPVVRFLSATGNNAANKITFYKVSAGPWNLVTNTAVAGQTTNFWTTFDASTISSNALVLVRHLGADSYERGRVYSSSTTNVTVKAAIPTSPLPGDMLYVETAAGTIPVGNATVTLNAGPILYGQPGLPLLIELSGTNGVQLNAVAGDYAP